MKDPTNDTHPEIERILIEGYRAMSDARKMKCVREMGIFSAQRILADVRQRHPEADERECELRVASRWLSADLMRKACGGGVEEKGY